MPPSDPCPSTTVAGPFSFCFLVLSFVRFRFDANIAYRNPYRVPCMYQYSTPPASISNDADFELKQGSDQSLPQLHCHGITSQYIVPWILQYIVSSLFSAHCSHCPYVSRRFRGRGLSCADQRAGRGASPHACDYRAARYPRGPTDGAGSIIRD